MRLIRVLFIMIVFATSISACGQGETAPPPPLSQDIVENLIKGNNRYIIQRKYITPECSKDLYNKFMRILKKNNINETIKKDKEEE